MDKDRAFMYIRRAGRIKKRVYVFYAMIYSYTCEAWISPMGYMSTKTAILRRRIVTLSPRPRKWTCLKTLKAFSTLRRKLMNIDG